MKKTQRKSSANRKNERQSDNYLRSHIDVLIETTVKLIATPISSLMTVFVIGIALLLPALLQIVGNNLGKINDQFQETAVITLYLRDNALEYIGLELSEGLLMQAEIVKTAIFQRLRH